jgi:hypothetical protein
MPPTDPAAVAGRVDACLDTLTAASNDARDAGEELLAAVVSLHEPAVRALLAALQDAGGETAIAEVAANAAVAPVLVLHGLHPDDVDTRSAHALQDALRVTGREGELASVHSGVATIRLRAESRGASDDDIVFALLDAVPELERVDVVTEVPVAFPTLRREPAVRRSAPPAPDTPHVAAGGCELCGALTTTRHGHGVDVEARRLVCLCDPCRIVLGANPHRLGRFRAIPERVIADPDFGGTVEAWEALGVPVSTAFFFHDTAAGSVVGFYPGPAGATESLLDPDDWRSLAATSALATDLAPDTEAMLVRRRGDQREAYLVPIDRCYSLVGLLRTHWKGFDGGQDAHDLLDDFFAQLCAEATRAPRVTTPAHAEREVARA